MALVFPVDTSLTGSDCVSVGSRDAFDRQRRRPSVRPSRHIAYDLCRQRVPGVLRRAALKFEYEKHRARSLALRLNYSWRKSVAIVSSLSI